MAKSVLILLRWSIIFALCSASSKSGSGGSNGALPAFKISLYVVVDKVLADHFRHDYNRIQQHVERTVRRVDAILKYLEPSGSIVLIGCLIHRWGPEPYIVTTAKGELLLMQTFQKLLAYARKRPAMWTADLIMLLTGRKLTYTESGSRKGSAQIHGVSLMGTACGINKLIIVHDDGNEDNLDMTICHEIGHALGSDHDGQGASKACPSTGYIMGKQTGLFTLLDYSSCSVAAVNKFLRSAQAACLFTDRYVPSTPTDPERARNRTSKCEKYLARGQAVVATEGLGLCTFTCYIDGMASFELADDNGTPCLGSDRSKKCVNAKCV